MLQLRGRQNRNCNLTHRAHSSEPGERRTTEKSSEQEQRLQRASEKMMMKGLLLVFAACAASLGEANGSDASLRASLQEMLSGTASADDVSIGHCESFAACETQTRPGVPARAAQQVEDILSSWDNAVSVENDAGKVADLFCNDGVLVATVSDHLRTARNEIKSYFEYFAVKGNKPVAKCSFISRNANNVFTDERTVQWNLQGNIVCARMSFVVERRNGNMCIQSLHSSLFPVEPEGLVNIDSKNNIVWGADPTAN
mmetsp:Transcript_11841/g.17651  ORF Transcript_11841/g.17651 Transcript_11841/m.17651 type:complete len:256 (-) Transcript_11841:74-841(-)